MKRFTLILSLLVAMVTTAMAQIDVTKAYRIKDVNTELYLTAFNHDKHDSGAKGGVGVADLDENSNEQVFYLEPTSSGYLLRTASDHYVIGHSWNVDALQQVGTVFTFADAGEGNFYLKKGDNYFKVQDLGDDGVYVFCDAPESLRATWALEIVSDAGYASLGNFKSNKAYILKTRERGGLTINDDATKYCSTNDAGRGKFVEQANTKNHFAVVAQDNKYYLYSVEAKKFLRADLSLVDAIGDVVAFRDASVEGAPRMSLYFSEKTNANINIGGDNEIQVNWWSSVDHGNAMLFVEVADFDPAEALAILSNVADITYNFVCNGVTLATQTKTIAKGEAFPEFNVTLPLGYEITGTKPEGTVTADITKDITVVVNNELLPFEAVETGTPTTWYYAQMHAYGSYHWYIAPAEDGASVRTQDHKFAADEVDTHLWGFVGTVEGGFKMVNKATTEAILSSNSGVATMASVNDATAFIAMGSQIGSDWFCMKNPAGNYLNAQGSVANETNCDFVINHWNENDGGSSFYLTEYFDEEVTVEVTATGWATKFFGESVHVPAGVNAYIVTGVDNGYVTKSQIIEGEVIPANTGILLENAGEYKFAKTVSYNYTLAGNLMNGSVEDTYVQGDAYVLSAPNGVIGFYLAKLNCDENGNEGETHFLNNAGKAYMVLPTTENAAAFYGFEWDGTTGVEKVEIRNEKEEIYDLTGRRVNSMNAAGIYIVNGRKVLVK